MLGDAAKNDLADLSRAEEESQPLHLELFDLTALAGEVTADLRVQADAKDIRLNVTQDGEQVAIGGNELSHIRTHSPVR